MAVVAILHQFPAAQSSLLSWAFQFGAASPDAQLAGPGLLDLLILLSGILLAAVLLHDRFRLKQRVRALSGWLEGMRQGRFAPEAVPADLPGGAPIVAAAQAFSTEIADQIGQLHDAAQLDPLTRLHNREHFSRLVAPRIAELREGGGHALLFIDLDGFKQVNDTLGHKMGDRLLQLAADRLRLSVRTRTVAVEQDEAPRNAAEIARFGGDEFVVFIPNITSEIIARKIAARIARVLAEPFELDTHGAHVSASIGIALGPLHGDNYGDLLRAADAAMYHSKRSPENHCTIFDAKLDEDARKRAENTQELHDAVARGEFVLFFQPLYTRDPLQICSAEALIRWRHPRRGLVPPKEFIPLAESTQLINQIGEWLINEAAKRIALLVEAGHPTMISVNISPGQLERVEFVSTVRAALQLWKAPAHLLQIEITENVAMRDSGLAAKRLHQISELGVSIAIDDFGTGYSNLASLIHLPFSRLKIDRSLICDLPARPEARVLMQTIITMAQNLGLKSVAEGVETREQLQILIEMGCDIVQGFYLARPLPIEKFMNLLSADSKNIVPPRSFTDAA